MPSYFLFDFNNIVLFRSIPSIDSTADFEQMRTNVPMMSSIWINTKLLHFCEQLHKKGISTGILTAGFSLSIPSVRDRVQSYFDHIFIAKKLGVSKQDSSTYTTVSKQVNQKPTEIMFTDDTVSNIEAASQAGCQTILFESNTSFFQQIEKLELTE